MGADVGREVLGCVVGPRLGSSVGGTGISGANVVTEDWSSVFEDDTLVEFLLITD